MDKFGQKSQNCQFKLKFGTYSKSSMLISMVMLPFFVFSTFLGKFGPKIQNVFFRVKFGACTGSRGAWGWLWVWGGVGGPGRGALGYH